MATITCAEAMKMFYAYLDRALKSDKLDDLDEHLILCIKCCDQVAFQKHLGEFFQEKMRRPSAPPGLEPSIRSALARIGTEKQ